MTVRTSGEAQSCSRSAPGMSSWPQGSTLGIKEKTKPSLVDIGGTREGG